MEIDGLAEDFTEDSISPQVLSIPLPDTGLRLPAKVLIAR